MNVDILEMDYAAYRPIWRHDREPGGPAAHTFGWPCKPWSEWKVATSDVKRYVFSQTKDPELDRLINNLYDQVTIEAYLKSERMCGKWMADHYYTSGIASVGSLFATSKMVPGWNLGGDSYNFHFEYLGATK